MLPKTKTERHSDICKEINALYARKNHDYEADFKAMAVGIEIVGTTVERR